MKISVILPVIYSPQMRDLKPPRSFSVTVAAILAIITGSSWLAFSVGAALLARDPKDHYPGLYQEVMVSFVLLGCIKSSYFFLWGLRSFLPPQLGTHTCNHAGRSLDLFWVLDSTTVSVATRCLCFVIDSFLHVRSCCSHCQFSRRSPGWRC